MNVGGKIYKTVDGVQNWKQVPMGRAFHKTRLLPTDIGFVGFVGYAIGTEVFQLKQDSVRLP